MPVVAMSVVVPDYPSIITAVNQVIDVGQVITGNNSVGLPYLISKGSVPALS
mgnify:CR=1 FL=1